MAINSLGYRNWTGDRAASWKRVIVIAWAGIRRAWQNPWMRRLFLLSWTPAIWFAAGFFLYEKSVEYPELMRVLVPFIRSSVSDSPQMQDAVQLMASGNLQDARHEIWAWLLQSFFRRPQGIVMVLVIGLIAPPLISQDIRSRAFLLYFSRPIGRSEYVLGKLSIVGCYLALISMCPALVLYLAAVLLSPEVGVVSSTWDLPLRTMAATVVLSLPTASLALCISSLTRESRTAAFAWFAIFILGWVTFGILSTVETLNQQSPESLRPFRTDSMWSLLSLYHTVGRVQSWVFGFATYKEVMPSTIALVMLTVVSLTILFRRVMAPMRE
ncbi:MAG: ABC transporter permease subunit [Planctomycetaceae bacterium]|nr:ABC transporter permease subunit [Planctomycetaceae bacterium]